MGLLLVIVCGLIFLTVGAGPDALFFCALAIPAVILLMLIGRAIDGGE